MIDQNGGASSHARPQGCQLRALDLNLLGAPVGLELKEGTSQWAHTAELVTLARLGSCRQSLDQQVINWCEVEKQRALVIFLFLFLFFSFCSAIHTEYIRSDPILVAARKSCVPCSAVSPVCCRPFWITFHYSTTQTPSCCAPGHTDSSLPGNKPWRASETQQLPVSSTPHACFLPS